MTESRVGILIDGESGNVAIYCANCGDLVLAIETEDDPKEWMKDHEHGTGRVSVNLDKIFP